MTMGRCGRSGTSREEKKTKTKVNIEICIFSKLKFLPPINNLALHDASP